MTYNEIELITDKHNELIEQIKELGREYAKTCKMEHPFTNYSFAGADFYNLKNGWRYHLSQSGFTISWETSSYRCGSMDEVEHTLNLPISLFDGSLEPTSNDEATRICTIKKEIEGMKNTLAQLAKNQLSLKKEKESLSSKYLSITNSYEAITGNSLFDPLLKEKYSTDLSLLDDKLFELSNIIWDNKKQLSILEEQL